MTQTVFHPACESIAKRLIELGQTVSVAESSTGGLIAASLLSIAGASSYFQGGSVVYTLKSRREFLDLDRQKLKTLEPLSEPMVLEFAHAARRRLDTTWGIAELGVAGPTGTPYGHDAGISVIGISGPLNTTLRISTGSTDRVANMQVFTDRCLELFGKTVTEASKIEQ